jgi:DNA-binding NarL/FixJ family response regulator
MRRSLKSLIETHPGPEVCDEASDGSEAVRMAKFLKLHIAILDIARRELNSLDAAYSTRDIPRFGSLSSSRSKCLPWLIELTHLSG